MSEWMLIALGYASLETIAMVITAGFFSFIIGLPLAVLLFASQHPRLWPKPVLHHSLEIVVNTLRSFPFFILMIALMPLTRALIGTSIGTAATIVPLSIASIPFVARLMQNSFNELQDGLLEAAQAMGATPWQMITKVILPESWAGLIQAQVVTLITLVGYSAMAGAIGGGGLGSMAFNEGYQRFNLPILIITVILLIVFVQIIQMIGNYCSKRVGVMTGKKEGITL